MYVYIEELFWLLIGVWGEGLVLGRVGFVGKGLCWVVGKGGSCRWSFGDFFIRDVRVFF